MSQGLSIEQPSSITPYQLTRASPAYSIDGDSYPLMPQQSTTAPGRDILSIQGATQTSQWTYGGWTASFLQNIPSNLFKNNLKSKQ